MTSGNVDGASLRRVGGHKGSFQTLACGLTVDMGKPKKAESRKEQMAECIKASSEAGETGGGF